jgi:RsiW-degrading membrane proteinase PrsW (M82 family)
MAMVLGSALMLDANASLALIADQASFDLELAQTALGAVVIAPLVEEPSKALILLPILYTRHFDNMTDGFVYGAAAGLGFGMTENYLYFVASSGEVGTWLGTVVIRTFYSAMMHATATAIVGAALGWARFRRPTMLLVSGTAGLTVAATIHILWNGLIAADMMSSRDGLWLADLIVLPVEIAITFAVFQVCLLDEARTIRYELKEEAAAGLVPADHPNILSSWWRRMGKTWLPKGVPHDAYVISATRLAMRKRQQRELGPRATEWYANDISRLRQTIGELLRMADPLAPR